ncbi:MAG: helix-turn-helix domain-containing protein [Eubacterium sp.]|nr:helix-turn-helix domain-containing protein [Eubacterium sp.]
MNNQREYLELIHKRLADYQERVSVKCRQKVEDIVQALVDERKRQGLSQNDIADMTGMRAPNIARIENFKSRASLETLLRYADALGLEMNLQLTDKISGAQ